MNMMTFVIISFIVESSLETIKNLCKGGKICFDLLGSIIISLVIVFATGADITELAGVHMGYGIGKVFTAIIISRGSNFTHDFVSMINKIYSNQKIINIKDNSVITEYNTNKDKK